MLASKNHFQRPGNNVAAGEKQPISERFTGGPKLLAAAIAAALSGTVPFTADAAGLGRLTVQSALGQPLRAEVEVTALGREEIGSLTARLAPPEAFRQAGLEYNPTLGNLRFAIEQRPNGSAVVHVTSAQPVNEPFVDLLVELNWASGRFVREYTFLLDPPELRMGRDTLVAGGSATSAPASVVRTAAVPAGPAAARPVSVAPVAASNATARAVPSTAPAPTPAPAAAPDGGAGAPAAIRVQTGDTLAKIAARVKPADVTVEQAVMAIYRANPRAFFGTVHQLLAGADLKIPDVEQMKAIDAADARREIRAQAAEFNAYRARLASAARSVEPTKAGRTAEGSVAARPDESSPPVASGDQLKLSRSGESTAAAAGSATGASAPSNAEMQVANDAALREQQERVSALERNVADLQQLVELKNRQLAELQRQVEAARAAGATATGTIGAAAPSAGAPAQAASTAPAPASTAAAPASTVAAPAPSADATGSTSDAASSAAPAPAVSDTSPPSATQASGDAVSADTKPAAETTSAAAPEPSAAPKAEATPAPAPAAAPEPGVLDSLMENPLVLPALVAIALGLGAYGVYSTRRRRKGEEVEDTLSSADAFTANSLFGSTGGQSVDTHASLFATSGRDSGVDVHSTEVDPIAEAEVYIAYGREAQAEEILKEALKRQPERQAIRLKLLEIHAARKDPIAFGALAQEMYDQAGGLNEEWPKVVTLGLAIDPANPLYTGQGVTVSTPQAVADAPQPSPGAVADEVPAIADLGEEADAAAAVFGEPGFDPASAAQRAFGESFAETVPMDGAEAASAADRASLEDEIPALDFDLDLETTVGRAGNALGALDAGHDEPASSDSALERAIDGHFELPTLDLDAGSAVAESGAGRATEPQGADEEIPALADLGDFEIDLPSLEGIDSRAPEQGDERPAVDLADLESGAGLGNLDFSSVDLELSDGDVGLAAADTAVAPTVASSRWQEMATKLDLASAYEEIGDKEGARELLQEVLDGGDVSQQQKARTMLAKIG
jgi:pilus assembly protein FimV